MLLYSINPASVCSACSVALSPFFKSCQTCLEWMGQVEDSLRTRASARPLLASQISRHRQVQLPDGAYTQRERLIN